MSYGNPFTEAAVIATGSGVAPHNTEVNVYTIDNASKDNGAIYLFSVAVTNSQFLPQHVEVYSARNADAVNGSLIHRVEYRTNGDVQFRVRAENNLEQDTNFIWAVRKVAG